MQVDSPLQNHLMCPVCLELAVNAVECTACNNIMCDPCVQALKSRSCPSCRQEDFRTAPSIVVRRMIGSLPQTCPNECGTNTTYGEMPNHLKRCERRKIACVCLKFTGARTEFLAHVASEHTQKLIETFDKD
jgi:hypothetical protein